MSRWRKETTREVVLQKITGGAGLFGVKAQIRIIILRQHGHISGWELALICAFTLRSSRLFVAISISGSLQSRGIFWYVYCCFRHFVNNSGTFFRRLRVFVIGAVLGAAPLEAAAAQFNVTKTNLVDRWITNVIEVRMPINRFVTQYRTNYVQQIRTNLVPVYRTNVLTRTLTNHVILDVVRTNYFVAYHTNLKALNLTNWSTVLVMKTNWHTQPVTNVVTIDLPVGNTPTPARPSRAGAVAVHPPAATAGNALAIEASRGTRRMSNNQVDVQLRVRWTNGATAPLLVQQWRIEREDGSILLFGQDPEFRRGLPTGKYRVQVKAQRDEKAPLLAARGNLAVSPGKVTLQQIAARKQP